MGSLLIIFAAFLTLGSATEQVVGIQPCPEVTNDACTINEVRVDPCNANKNCILRQGTTGRMSVNFTPNFNATKMKFGLYWEDVPFPNLVSNNACDYTTCPVQAGQSQSLVYSLPIGKKLPKGRFLFKCRFENEEDKSQTCCFKTTVQIVKGSKN